MFKKKEPSLEEKRKLRGESNVEALLSALDDRLIRSDDPEDGDAKAEIFLVGRASYELGDKEFRKNLRHQLKEGEKFTEGGKLDLTEDVDVLASEGAVGIVDMATKDTYLANLCGCYIHSLSLATLFLPKGWESRVEDIPFNDFKNLRIKRLNKLDFIFCKAAAGRPKDVRFLKAFIEITGISKENICSKFEEIKADPPFKYLEEERNLSAIFGRLCDMWEEKKFNGISLV